MKWTSVEHRLPKRDTAVLMWHRNRPYSFVFGVYIADGNEFMRQPCANEVQFPLDPTHWTEITPPEIE